ncbi:centrosomal protein CEP57L1 [Periophthalmus magnuspinnatus]|uniref:centrosomal protein CEP57L1 n=1 Tax=Periophthalmus magnuspinnatus TaxID=409849 RepID=UPI00145A6A22|nr:centrosomal protein CEP57L1 [Periophthalmus magnuspinnatus]
MEEAPNEQGLDSPSRNSYIGSYYQPPDRMMYLPRRLDFPFHSVEDPPTTSHHVSQSKSNIDSKAVVDALKTLQEKIRRTEVETSRHAEKSQQVSHEAQNQQSSILTTLPITHNQQKQEHDGIIRCRILQKHLEKTKRSIERVKREHETLLENRSTLQKEQFNTNIQLQKEKLERLESEYEKLSRTQTLAEMKLTMLEEKLKKEEHERKLVQEKAEELQREFDNTLRMSPEETKIKKKNKIKMTLKQSEQKSPICALTQKMPFVAGTSTSPSHSVHANVQSVLHLMKHHQPQLHERVSLLHRSVGAARKSLRKKASSSVLQRHNSESSESEQSLSSLSDLLLALQDELGQMSFEHLELMQQIDGTHDHKNRQDLKNELERLVTKMEEKGAQITKLRKHQQMIHKMAESQKHTSCCEEPLKTTMIHPLAPVPVKLKKRPQKQPSTPSNLQLLRETQQFRNSLKQSDLLWET